MSPGLKFTLGRIGLFALVVLALLPFDLNVFLTLMIALLISLALSYVLLRRWREEFAAQLASRARRRQDEKERLRSALAGEDEQRPPSEQGPEGPTGRH